MSPIGNYLDITIQRNEHRFIGLVITDKDGVPIDDLNTFTYSFAIGLNENSTAPAIAHWAVTVDDATTGLLSINAGGGVLDGVPGTQEIVRIAYNLIAIRDPEALILMRGAIILNPGVVA